MVRGLDGPAAMIMPGDPQVGDVYRLENIPGLVFEEVTVTAVDQTVDGPLGPIEGALVITELHMDGAMEDKTFAPGYGEFYTAGGGDVEALALAVPTDAVGDPLPEELTTLATAATDAFDAARSEDWAVADAGVADMAAAWEAYAGGEVPALIEPLMTDAVDAAVAAVDANDASAAQAAIDVERLALDLQLRYRPASEVDVARFGLWARQLLIDAAADDMAAVRGDQFSVDMVRDRIASVIDGDALTGVNTAMEELNGAVGDEDPAAVAEVADQLREIVAGL